MNNGTVMQEQHYVPNIPRKHSRMGIASFIIALAQGFLTLLVIIFAGILTMSGPQHENEAGFAVLGLFIIGGIFTHLVGVGLGIAGMVQKNRKKVFSILGFVFNITVILFVILLMLIGVMVE